MGAPETGLPDGDDDHWDGIIIDAGAVGVEIGEFPVGDLHGVLLSFWGE